MNKIIQSQKKAEVTKGKDIQLFIGNTGAGKTTSICWYLGCKIVAKRRNEKIAYHEEINSILEVEDKPKELEKFKIGHNLSET